MIDSATQTLPVDPLLISIADAGRHLGCSRGQIYKLLAEGDLEAVKLGARRMLVTASVLAYVNRLRAAAADRAAS